MQEKNCRTLLLLRTHARTVLVYMKTFAYLKIYSKIQIGDISSSWPDGEWLSVSFGNSLQSGQKRNGSHTMSEFVLSIRFVVPYFISWAS